MRTFGSGAASSLSTGIRCNFALSCEEWMPLSTYFAMQRKESKVRELEGQLGSNLEGHVGSGRATGKARSRRDRGGGGRASCDSGGKAGPLGGGRA